MTIRLESSQEVMLGGLAAPGLASTGRVNSHNESARII